MENNLSISNFRKTIEVVLFALLMCVCVYPTILFIGGLYSSEADKNTVNWMSRQRWSDFYALPTDSLDIAFLGSSHSYCSFDPENFDSILGTSSFQLGMPLQHMDATYFTALEMFNYQKPSLVVIEVYWDLLSKEHSMKQALTLFDSLNNDELETRYIKEVFGIEEQLKYKMDIINYQSDYFNYQSSEIMKSFKERYNIPDIMQNQEGSEYYVSKGYYYSDYQILPDEYGKTNQFNRYNGINYEINPKQRSYLIKTVELCKENNAEVVFVMAPVANISLTKMTGYSFINKKIKELADNLSVNYIDYNMPDIRNGMFVDANFRDDAHLNDSGVKVLNRHFLEYLTGLGLIGQTF